MKIFFDTGTFIALLVKNDTNHDKVLKKYQEYQKQRASFFTSHYILDELYTRLIYDFNKKVAQKATQEITQAQNSEELAVLQIDQLIFNKSIEAFVKFGEHKISFTDATVYVLVKMFKLDEVFTLDKDFKKMRLATSF